VSEHISCPGCRRILSLPRDCMDPWLACPGCAARILNPQAVGITAQPEPEPDRRVRFCPSCRAGVEAHWLFCPHCEEPLHDPRHRTSGNGNLDVSQQDGTSGGFMGLLAMFGLAGLTLALLGSVFALWVGFVAPLVLTLMGLGILASIGAVSELGQPKRPGQSTAARVVMVTLSLAGVLVALLSVPAFLFLVPVCLTW
jgi:hypothetical protein